MNYKTAAISIVFLLLSISGCSTLNKSNSDEPEIKETSCEQDENGLCRIDKEHKPADLPFLEDSD